MPHCTYCGGRRYIVKIDGNNCEKCRGSRGWMCNGRWRTCNICGGTGRRIQKTYIRCPVC